MIDLTETDRAAAAHWIPVLRDILDIDTAELAFLEPVHDRFCDDCLQDGELAVDAAYRYGQFNLCKDCATSRLRTKHKLERERQQCAQTKTPSTGESATPSANAPPTSTPTNTPTTSTESSNEPDAEPEEHHDEQPDLVTVPADDPDADIPL